MFDFNLLDVKLGKETHFVQQSERIFISRKFHLKFILFDFVSYL